MGGSHDWCSENKYSDWSLKAPTPLSFHVHQCIGMPNYQKEPQFSPCDYPASPVHQLLACSPHRPMRDHKHPVSPAWSLGICHLQSWVGLSFKTIVARESSERYGCGSLSCSKSNMACGLRLEAPLAGYLGNYGYFHHWYHFSHIVTCTHDLQYIPYKMLMALLYFVLLCLYHDLVAGACGLFTHVWRVTSPGNHIILPVPIVWPLSISTKTKLALAR